MTGPAVTPRYVHYLLDTLLAGAPLNFHGQPVPRDVQARIVRGRPRPIPAAPAARAVPMPAPAPAAPPSPAPVPAALPTPAPPPAAPPHPRALTDRELSVLRGMADGHSNLRIGADLDISEDTVKTHARRLFRKLGARDRAHAVALGFRAGVLS